MPPAGSWLIKIIFKITDIAVHFPLFRFYFNCLVDNYIQFVLTHFFNFFLRLATTIALIKVGIPINNKSNTNINSIKGDIPESFNNVICFSF